MALSETTVQDKIEVVDCGGWKVIQVRTATVISRDDVEISVDHFIVTPYHQQTIGLVNPQRFKPCVIHSILQRLLRLTMLHKLLKESKNGFN